MSPEYIADVLPYLRKLARQAGISSVYTRAERVGGYNDFYILGSHGQQLNDKASVDAEILRLQNIAAVKRGERVR